MRKLEKGSIGSNKIYFNLGGNLHCSLQATDSLDYDFVSSIFRGFVIFFTSLLVCKLPTPLKFYNVYYKIKLIKLQVGVVLFLKKAYLL